MNSALVLDRNGIRVSSRWDQYVMSMGFHMQGMGKGGRRHLFQWFLKTPFDYYLKTHNHLLFESIPTVL